MRGLSGPCPLMRGVLFQVSAYGRFLFVGGPLVEGVCFGEHFA